MITVGITMDPDATLAALRELIGLYNSGQATGADTDRIVDLSQALDEWFTRGGFLPAAWQKLNSTVTCPSCGQQHGGRDCDRMPQH